MITDNDIRVELALPEDLCDLAEAVRKRVFIQELGIPEGQEFDGNDKCAARVVAYIQKKQRKIPIGTMRIRFFADFVKFERMAVMRGYRKTNVSEDIMQYAYNYVAIKGYRHVCGMCKKELLPRWQRSGYYVIKDAPIVEQNGMTLIPICRDLPPHPRALTMTSDPSLLIAPEGYWYNRPQFDSIEKYNIEKAKKRIRSHLAQNKKMADDIKSGIAKMGDSGYGYISEADRRAERQKTPSVQSLKDNNADHISPTNKNSNSSFFIRRSLQIPDHNN